MKIILILILSCKGNLENVNKVNLSSRYIDKLTDNKSIEESKMYLENNDLSSEELKQSFFYAAKKCNIDILKLILSKGIDINIEDKVVTYRNALEICLAYSMDVMKTIETVEFLIESGIEICAKDRSPLVLFVENVLSNQSETALDDDTKKKIKETIHLFLAKGISIDSLWKRDTALSKAIKDRNEDIWLAELTIELVPLLIIKKVPYVSIFDWEPVSDEPIYVDEIEKKEIYKDILLNALDVSNKKSRELKVKLILANRDKMNIDTNQSFRHCLRKEVFDKEVTTMLKPYYKFVGDIALSCCSIEALNFVLNNFKVQENLSRGFHLFLSDKFSSLEKLNYIKIEPVDRVDREKHIIRLIDYAVDKVRYTKPRVSTTNLKPMTSNFVYSVAELYHPFTLIKYAADEKDTSTQFIEYLSSIYDREEEKYTNVSWYYIDNVKLDGNIDIKSKQLDLIKKILVYLSKKDELAKTMLLLNNDLIDYILKTKTCKT